MSYKEFRDIKEKNKRDKRWQCKNWWRQSDYSSDNDKYFNYRC